MSKRTKSKPVEVRVCLATRKVRLFRSMDAAWKFIERHRFAKDLNHYPRIIGISVVQPHSRPLPAWAG